MHFTSFSFEVKRRIFEYLDAGSLATLYATLDRNLYRFFASKGALSELELDCGPYSDYGGILRLLATVVSEVETLRLKEGTWSAHALSSLLRSSNPRRLIISRKLLPKQWSELSDPASLARAADFNEFGLPHLHLTCPRLEHLSFDRNIESLLILPTNPSMTELKDFGFALRVGAVLSLPPSLSSVQLHHLSGEYEQDLIAALPESLERLDVVFTYPSKLHLLDYLGKFKSLVSLIARVEAIFIPKEAVPTELKVSPFLETLQVSQGDAAIPKDFFQAPWFRKLPLTNLTVGTDYSLISDSGSIELFSCLPASITSLKLIYRRLTILTLNGRAFPTTIRSLDLCVGDHSPALEALVHLVNLESLRLKAPPLLVTETDYRDKRMPPIVHHHNWEDERHFHFRMLPPNVTSLILFGYYTQCLTAPLVEASSQSSIPERGRCYLPCYPQTRRTASQLPICHRNKPRDLA